MKFFQNKPLIRKVRIRVLLLVLASIVAVNFIPGGKDCVRRLVWTCMGISFPTELELKGSAAEMGTEYGNSLKYSIKILSQIYVKRILCSGDQNKFDSCAGKSKRLFSEIDPAWTEELEAIARASGTDLDALLIGNCFLDLGLNTAACRQIISSENGKMLHAHNMDWDNLGGFGNLMVTVLRRNPDRDRFRTVSVIFPGMLGALDIINEKGISLSFNQLGNSDGKSKMPIFIKMRDIAETCSSFEEAEAEIMSLPEGMPFSIGLADAGSCKSAVFERDMGLGICRRDMSGGILTADNSPWHGRSMATCAVDKIAREKNARSVDTIIETLRDPQVLLECNIYSLIWNFKDNSFLIACGDIPAACGKYREFELFHSDPGEF